MRLPVKLNFLVIITVLITSQLLIAGESVYYRNFVYHSTGDFCKELSPEATFTAFLNSDQSKVLIENAPRWDGGTESNITGNGTFALELGNFNNPAISVGDTIRIRFTCNKYNERAELVEQVVAIPWTRFPLSLNLVPVQLPTTPQNITVGKDNRGYNVLQWDVVQNLSYQVYRKSFTDTLTSGRPRNLYYRIADSLTVGTFIDSTAKPDDYYGYIFYAVSSDGKVSAHSEEKLVLDGVTGLKSEVTATTALLSWRKYQSPSGKVVGYNIYRRSADGAYGNPIAYTGLDTTYCDSRLAIGESYSYKIKARLSDYTEIGESVDLPVTTENDPENYASYANLKIAVAVYQNTNAGSIDETDCTEIRKEIEVARMFYWRNSVLKLNTEITYYPISAYRNFGDPDDYNLQLTVNDLKEYGVVNTQFDIIFRITPAVNGYWSFGVIDLNFVGPQRKTGFSQVFWPVSTGVIYPAPEPGMNYSLTWTFIHEVQHAIDAIYNENGAPEMAHGDQPYLFDVPCGEHLDFQAKIFRTFKRYEILSSDWGDIYESADIDHDGFVDNDSRTPLDEVRFGSSSQSADSDQDGYTDYEEAIDGIYCGSDPNNPDTDGDGTLDGKDRHPRFPVNTLVKRFTPVIDGDIEAGWPLINDTVSYTQLGYSPRLYVSYDDAYLYLGLSLKSIGIPEFIFDFQNDGWWYSSGNSVIRLHPTTGEFLVFHSWDASPDVREYNASLGGTPDGMWDDNSQYQMRFGRRVLNPGKVLVKTNSIAGIIQIEMAIPKSDYAGLTLEPGDSLGLNIKYYKVNNDPKQWASTFDQYSYVYFKLDSSSDSTNLVENDLVVPDRFYLSQNYPNPFNPVTTIEYGVPDISKIELAIYDILGRRVRLLVNGTLNPGNYRIIWNGKNELGEQLPNGVYFCRLSSLEGKSELRKMILLK